MSVFQTVRGMRDFLPEEAEKMSYLQAVTRELAQLYGYKDIITPIVEYYDLLAAKSGEEIRDRLYVFNDLGGRKVALRPEFTAPIARLVATKMAYRPKPTKLFCLGSLYRYDEPQFGRFREFWQADYELIGASNPEADAEILTLSYDLMERLGLHNYYFKIGHVGILRGILNQENVGEESQNRLMQLIDKKKWSEALIDIRELGISERGLKALSSLFKTRGLNFLNVIKRIKSCVQGYENAIMSVENLQEILELTIGGGTKLNLLIDAGFARGLEYYTGLIFELYIPEMQIALGGGGRYDKLIELFGGGSTPAVGVAPGLDRILLALGKQKVIPKTQEEKQVMIIPIGKELRVKAVSISLMLRKLGIPTEVEIMGRTVSRALSDSERRGITYAIIIGPEEIKEDKVILRDMKKREQKSIEISSIHKEISKNGSMRSHT